MAETPVLALTRVAASPDPLSQRPKALLSSLRAAVGYDAAWLALADPPMSCSSALASVDLDDGVVDVLSGPQMAQDIEITDTDRHRPPPSPSGLPYAPDELSTWAACLMPTGIHKALGIALFAPDGRHVGFLALLPGARTPPGPAQRRELGALAPVLALGVDPMRSLLTVVRLVRGARAGAAVRRDGRTEPLSGLEVDPLLRSGSPVLSAARERLEDGQLYSCFLWPLGGPHAPSGHVRVTVVVPQDDGSTPLLGVVLLSPAGDLHGLTPRELEVLGFIVEGCSNREIARALVLAPRTVATHVEHVLVKLKASTRTLAAVRAEREGVYVPVPPASCPIPGAGELG